MADPLLTRVPVDEMPEPARAAWEALDALTGQASFVEVFAATPELLAFVMQRFYGEIFFGGRVAERYKQLMRLKLSMIHGCRTCNLQNVPGVRAAGFDDAQIAALDEYRTGPFSDAEKAVLEYAELLSNQNQTRTLDADLHGRLETHFGDDGICELGMVGAVISGLARLAFVLDLVEREDYCSFRP